MADVDIKQVVRTLKKKFIDDKRLIFWFDDEGEFSDSITELRDELVDVATVVELKPGHQVETKLQLLNAAYDEKFLIYSPQPQPAVEENHLRDMILYSDTFKADAEEILRRDMHLPQSLYFFVKEHIKFFGNKERRNRFMKYDLSSYETQPTQAIMAVIVRLEQPVIDFFGLLQNILNAGVENNQYLSEFEKYGILDDFWKMVEQQFGFNGSNELLELCKSLYVTMAFQQMEVEMSENVDNYDLSSKAANVQTFMQQFSAQVLRRENTNDRFSIIAQQVWDSIPNANIFNKLNVDDWAKSDVFISFDVWILNWLVTQLKLKNNQALVNGLTIGQLTKKRREMHYALTGKLRHSYLAIENAWKLFEQQNRQSSVNIDDMIQDYVSDGYLVDSDYRHFIFEYQKSEFSDDLLDLKQLVESYYVDYLSNISSVWNHQMNYEDLSPRILQRNFYKQYVSGQQNRIVVIISDSLRFEVAKELEARLGQQSQVTDLKMHYLLSGLPSVTYMGMAALLPHQKLELQSDTHQVYVDGYPVNNVEQRAEALRRANKHSITYRYKDLQDKNRDQIRAMFADQEVVYIYHNQIDTVAENQGTEDDTFVASDEAIKELESLILRLRTNSINHIYVTADHGYLYRDNKLAPIDKIEVPTNVEDWKSPRYLVSKRLIKEPGIKEQSIGAVLNDDDSRKVYSPTSANVFKANGGDNYVHGGSSIQEMLIPVLEIKTTQKRSTANVVEIQIVTSNRRITSLEVPLTVMQTNAISADVLPAVFKLYFVDDQDLQISGQTIVNANKKSPEISDRIHNVQVILKDQSYKRDTDYYLVIENIENGEKDKIKFTMDIMNNL
ncbi:BREX-1 system phosphatase PglZ type A [Lactiplantibacillus paraxiangfangensis]|uniref:BREX-1 system phosphatase PglZ type A n=1 Tax=Lactiplantibacillus paraxiangfangensis TaxID=3076224 RepID=UPI0030C7736E